MVDAVVLRMKITKTLGRVMFRKEFWDCRRGQAKNWPIAVQRVPSNYPKNNCGTHFGSSHLVFKVANGKFHTMFLVKAEMKLKLSILSYLFHIRNCEGKKPNNFTRGKTKHHHFLTIS